MQYTRCGRVVHWRLWTRDATYMRGSDVPGVQLGWATCDGLGVLSFSVVPGFVVLIGENLMRFAH